ncbi:hypothetical protein L1987_13376 [Smallanthus sonchifolius]|uniref:Uncharacterized protein n=1 Tax=Smallanthus sonchifolius TaxID=185202 RepID=A0ACB9JIF2_9ASTR|nr:hypothetical protein L1987_13376 [Smallanthus sonchifolius]
MVLGKRRRGIEPRANSTGSQSREMAPNSNISNPETACREEEAIEFSNDTRYGLAAAVISNDPERCDRVIKVKSSPKFIDIFSWPHKKAMAFMCTMIFFSL